MDHAVPYPEECVLSAPARTFVIVLTCLFALWSATSTFASRAPTAAERGAILKLIQNPYPKGWARRSVRISTADSRWAAVSIIANNGHASQVQDDVGTVYRLANGRWVVHQKGNGGGCRVPASVVHDLRLACY
jgi:hypothetical protein